MNQRIMDDGPALNAIVDVIENRTSVVDKIAVIAAIVRNTGRECDE